MYKAGLAKAEELARFWPSTPPTAAEAAAEAAKQRLTAGMVSSQKVLGQGQ
jgi:hypothetical protein